MKIIIFIFFFFGLICNDIMRPEDNFKDINYQEDMGICSNTTKFYSLITLVGVTGNNSNMTEYEKFQAFNEHNCRPVVILEGVKSTKLQLMITDCNALSDNILKHCNIMTEKNKHRWALFSLKFYLDLFGFNHPGL